MRTAIVVDLSTAVIQLGLLIVVGVFAILLASSMQNVLQLMLYSYAFMVSGLLIPVLGILYFKRKDPGAAFDPQPRWQDDLRQV
ncbi:MAG: hypothetical protein P8Z42_00480 [Anaerolineales bacterium]